MSEAQKYQGALYQGEKKKGNKNKNNNSKSQAVVPQKQAYVEDADDEYSGRPFSVDPPEGYTQILPAAPSPPPAAPDFEPESVNVFDFLDESQTPNASRLDLSASEPTPMVEDTPRSIHSDDEEEVHEGAMVQYGNGPVEYETPVPSARTSKRESKASSDKKRKRLHVDTQDFDTSPARETEDALMTDAPPVLHSGLTGGLKGLLARPSVFPPSPDYSGDAADEPDQSPGSPLKRSKHAKTSSKRKGRDSIGNNLMSLITTGGLIHKHADDLPRKKKSKNSKDAKKSSLSKKKKSTTAPSTELQTINPAARTLLEYKPKPKESLLDEETKMILHEARAELFMGFVNKGPESEKGYSMNKALKRYHRECEGLGVSKGKSKEEKELWRSLRLKRNERGEVVVFF